MTINLDFLLAISMEQNTLIEQSHVQLYECAQVNPPDADCSFLCVLKNASQMVDCM